MTRWEVFRRIAAWLRPTIKGEAPDFIPAEFPWEMAVEAASYHMVTPALSWCLLKNGSLPAEVAQYFEAILDMNRMRNRALLDELETVLRELNGADIRPVLLKGAAFVAEGSYPDPGMRLLADLDILIPEPQLHTASNALIDAGFTPPRTELPTPDGHHHLPAQTNPATGITVELHRQPSEPSFRELVDARRCFDAGHSFLFRGCEAIIPSATDRIAHGIAHGQLSDRNHRRGVPELRQLLDLAVLRMNREAQIDWPELDRRFEALGFSAVLADTFTCAEFLLDQALPPTLQRRDKAISRLKGTFERDRRLQSGMNLLWTFRDAAMALRADPRRLLTAFRRKRWRSAAQGKKW